ncbi:hypothetical protein [Flavobacterium luteum]|uniref:Uncharacterized protein n=1 Tax=Flavobacterium luteum TaxID=2026654 RepID=A0A7J5A9Z8_9FLAO|nr:hypothetical protein [Flavobacterium luteum]KAB1154391.1 hypothetical protein F6464_12610 [Flavobacterium luteum]
MTIEQLYKFLTENSPFKFKGSSEDLYYFDAEYYSINEGEKYKFTLSKVSDSFIFNDGGLFPVFQNVIIETTGELNSTVILNMNTNALKNDRFRHNDAEDGYLILIPYR